MSTELENISTADLTAGTVLAGAIWRLEQDPQLCAMAERNDEERFVEGCLADPSFARKIAHALINVREAALARYEEVAAMGKDLRTGRTVPTGDKVRKVKAEKGLPYDVDAVVHMPICGTYTLSKVRSVRLQLEEPRDWPGFTIDAFRRALGLADVETGRSAYATPVTDEADLIDESGRDWLAELTEAQGDVDAIAALGSAARAQYATHQVVAVIRGAYQEAKRGIDALDS